MASVRDFGAIGDGQADDTDAFQRAADGGDGLLFAPRGDYRLTRPVTIDLAAVGRMSVRGASGSRLIMAGPGPAIRIVGGHEGSADPNSLAPGVWERQGAPTVRDLEIFGDHVDADGVELEGAVKAILSGLVLRRCRNGIRLFRRNRDVIISDCHVYQNRRVGVFLDRVNLHQINIHGCHISYNAGGGIKVLCSEIRNLQITGNDIEYNFDRAARDADLSSVPVTADVWIDTAGASVREGTIASNTIQALPTPGGANVRIQGEPDTPIKAGFWSITGNLISNQDVNVHLKSCRGVTVSGNVFFGGGQATILAEDAEVLTMVGNTIDHNPDYGKDRRDGIQLLRCRAATVGSSVIQSCAAGSSEEGGAVDVRACDDVKVCSCQILDPAHRGVYVTGGQRVLVSDCSIHDQGAKPSLHDAIRIDSGNSHVVSGNVVSRGRHGALCLSDGVVERGNEVVASG